MEAKNFVWEIDNFGVNGIYIDTISVTDQLMINLINEDNKQIQLVFEAFLFFSIVDESNVGKRIEELYNSGLDVEKIQLFKLSESWLINQFHSDGYGFLSDMEIIHYGIYTENECINVLCTIGNIPEVIYI